MNEPLLPWYKQFWPWALIALPGTAVFASITTMIIALREPDPLVVDDYYKEGMGINRTITQQQRAAKLQLHASAQYHEVTQTLVLSLDSNGPAPLAQLRLHLIHPTLAQQDVAIMLALAPDGKYHAQLKLAELNPTVYWRAILEDTEKTWRLSTTVSPATQGNWEFIPEL